MMSILSILVFMLVQRHVVSASELFPVSMFEVDSDEHQPIDSQKNDEIEPFQGKNITERFDDLITAMDILWLDRITSDYGFKRHHKDPKWISQPSFKSHLGRQYFDEAAEIALNFFRKFNQHLTKSPWELLKEATENDKFKLLKITAARYLLVTHILWDVSGKKLVACTETRDSYTDIPQSWKIPKDGVCFPKPYGSARYNSDYDVGLIGKDSGTVTQKFNDYFENTFHKPSELVFDTNVYAYTLEFAMPSMFPDLLPGFISNLNKLEQSMRYKMLELASAYYKVFKYDENNELFNEMKNGAITQLKIGDKKALEMLQYWLTAFQGMNYLLGFKKGPNEKLAGFRRKHNKKYQYYLQKMSKKGGYAAQYTEFLAVNLAKALPYAAEAYHTRGAIRHVVQGIQMNAISTCEYYTPLSTFDLWVSMIENWGEAIKEYQHCGRRTSTAECLMKMSKYLSRMFNAMRVIRRARLPREARERLLDFGTIGDPEFVTNLLLKYKGSGKGLSSAAFEFVELFLQQFKCDVKPFDLNFPWKCLKNIHAEVNEYNTILASKVNKIKTLTAL
ncbi:uncharacterized protein LOC111342763 isoform X2 [Stylophora pistillata]|nr:uncharacterized protein LOC111342763 isoform X2 [Stylophora pistillata]